NGAKISDFITHEGSLEIPAKYLAALNTIVIEYSNGFAEDGSGLTHFTDPSDGKEYIYSDSEPYGAHKIFPGFDQPNLKANYSVNITAPKEWKAIANELESRSDEQGEETTHGFFETKPFSTYLVFIGAGNFHQWQSDWKGRPVMLYARESLAQYVDADTIFTVTKKGLDFYSEYFGYSYPFSKYGQVFCPDMGPGAMENPGSVSMNERMIYKGPQSESVYNGRANTILHEMAHMWFGDLVTMNWWNDLWLNESFATFMATYAQEHGMGLGERAWLSFGTEKGWAYWQDQLVTTHPIVTEVADTDVASTNFDGITYAKGASTLKQLHFFVGDENFRRGVRNYFQKFAWKNATRTDFIGEIAQSANVSLDAWSKGWLESAGLNHVTPVLQCREGKVESLSLNQEPTRFGAYLPHKTNLAFYRKNAGALVAYAQLTVKYEGASTAVDAAKGLECPDLLEPNAGDEDYAIANLDAGSLQNVALLSTIASPLERQMLWGALYQMVRNSTLKLTEYFSFFEKNLPLENNDDVLSSLIGKYNNNIELYWNILSKENRALIAPRLENIALNGMKSASAGSNAYYMWLDYFIGVSDSVGSQAELSRLLTNPELDQERRWKVIVKLSALGAPEAQALAAAEAKSDTSDSGRNSAFAANVAQPLLASKQDNWKLITDFHSALSLAQRKAGGEQFNNADHPEIAAEFVEPFFVMVKGFKWDGQMFLMNSLFEGLFPKLCSSELLSQSTQALESSRAALPTIALRAWLEANDELTRCVAIRSYDKR
ncbi:MAG: aminopeptidase N, partial [Bdellovibrionota bacterium]